MLLPIADEINLVLAALSVIENYISPWFNPSILYELRAVESERWHNHMEQLRKVGS
jgi:hypothetical protein